MGWKEPQQQPPHRPQRPYPDPAYEQHLDPIGLVQAHAHACAHAHAHAHAQQPGLGRAAFNNNGPYNGPYNGISGQATNFQGVGYLGPGLGGYASGLNPTAGVQQGPFVGR